MGREEVLEYWTAKNDRITINKGCGLNYLTLYKGSV